MCSSDLIAIPHAKSDAVKTPGLTALTIPAGIDYGAPDGAPSNLLFMIADQLDIHTGSEHKTMDSRTVMVWLSPWRILRGSLPSYFPRLFPPLPGPFQQ